MVVQIAAVPKVAGAIAAQVVAVRGHATKAVRSRIARSNAVLERHTVPYIVVDAAARIRIRSIPADGAVADNGFAAVGDPAASAETKEARAPRDIAAQRAVAYNHSSQVIDATAIGARAAGIWRARCTGAIGCECAVADRQRG